MKEYAKESLDMKKNFRGGGLTHPRDQGVVSISLPRRLFPQNNLMDVTELNLS